MIGPLLTPLDTESYSNMKYDTVHGIVIFCGKIIPYFSLRTIKIATVYNDGQALGHGHFGFGDTFLSGLHFILVHSCKLYDGICARQTRFRLDRVKNGRKINSWKCVTL